MIMIFVKLILGIELMIAVITVIALIYHQIRDHE